MSIEKDIQNLTKTVQSLITHLEANPHAIPDIQAGLPSTPAATNTATPNPPVQAAVPQQPQGVGAALPDTQQRVANQIHQPEQAQQIIAANQQGGFSPQVVQSDGQIATPVNANAQLEPLTLQGVNTVLQAEMVRLGDQGMPIILGILQQFGSQKLGEINPQLYPQVVAAIQAAQPQGVV